MADLDRDAQMRMAAFEHVRRLGEVYDHLTANELKPGFIFEGERIPLVNPQRGIFKPRQMRYLLSIKTVFPRPGAKVWYDDQRQVHRQIFDSEETVEYAFMGQDPDAADNRWLREAFENQTPVIYFLNIAPGRYQAMLPTFIAGWDGTGRLKARIAFGILNQQDMVAPESALERRYALREVKQRLHQASFREAVITAYNGRCALSGLGNARWRRLIEERAGSAKSVFHFDVQGSVAKSTHAGIPWLRFIRRELGPRIHFWPFNGWDIPPGRSNVSGSSSPPGSGR